MDLSRATEAHTAWKVKLRVAIGNRDKLDAVKISADNCCELGKWLHGAARSEVGPRPELETLLTTHATFHREAGRVAERINARDFPAARAMLEKGSTFVQASHDVASAIGALRRVLRTAAAA